MPAPATPPAVSSSRRIARAEASAASSAFNPFSKRSEASVRCFSADAVRRVFAPEKLAASSRTFVVCGATSELAPPITPASASPSSASAISR